MTEKTITKTLNATLVIHLLLVLAGAVMNTDLRDLRWATKPDSLTMNYQPTSV